MPLIDAWFSSDAQGQEGRRLGPLGMPDGHQFGERNSFSQLEVTKPGHQKRKVMPRNLGRGGTSVPGHLFDGA